MKLITKPIVIDETNSYKNDILDRKKYGETLRNLIVNSGEPLVISLNGNWGEGKTTFIRMWQGLLDESSIPNIYIDAFANDFLDDAFVSLISAITSYAENNIKKEDKEKIAELKEKAKKVGVQLLSMSARLAIKAATLGVIKDVDIDALTEIKDDLSKNTSDLIGDFIEERINSHLNDIEQLELFKRYLSELPAKLQEDTKNPLVLIVDELDRCKPSFAVEMVERIKHLFSVENVVFLLVMNKSQLEESVRCIYGQKIDAHNYLQKFINLETSIPKRAINEYENDINKYIGKLMSEHEIPTWGDDNYITDSLEIFGNHFNLSLRQLENTFTNIALYYSGSAENQLRLAHIIVFLSLVKVIDPDLYSKIASQNISYSEVDSKLDLSGLGNKLENSSKAHWIIQWLKYTMMNESEFKQLSDHDEIKDLGKHLYRYNHISRERLIPFFSQMLNLFIASTR